MSWLAEPGWPVFLSAVLIPVDDAFSARRIGGGQLSFVSILLASTAIGAAAGKVRTTTIAAPILLEQIGAVRIEGTITEIDASERSRRIRIAVRANEGLTPQQTPVFVRVSVKDDITPANGGAELHIDPCFLGRQGGVVLELSALGRSLRVAPPEADRPWTPQLHAQSSKPKALPKPKIAKPAASRKAKAPKSDADSSAPAIKPEPKLQ